MWALPITHLAVFDLIKNHFMFAYFTNIHFFPPQNYYFENYIFVNVIEFPELSDSIRVFES